MGTILQQATELIDIFQSSISVNPSFEDPVVLTKKCLPQRHLARWRDGHIHRPKAFLLESVHVIRPGMAFGVRPGSALVQGTKHGTVGITIINHPPVITIPTLISSESFLNLWQCLLTTPCYSKICAGGAKTDKFQLSCVKASELQATSQPFRTSQVFPRPGIASLELHGWLATEMMRFGGFHQ